MNTQTDTKAYKGGSLNRTQAQWVADWLRTLDKELPGGWANIWKMNAKQLAAKFHVSENEVIAAGNGEKR